MGIIDFLLNLMEEPPKEKEKIPLINNKLQPKKGFARSKCTLTFIRWYGLGEAGIFMRKAECGAITRVGRGKDSRDVITVVEARKGEFDIYVPNKIGTELISEITRNEQHFKIVWDLTKGYYVFYLTSPGGAILNDESVTPGKKIILEKRVYDFYIPAKNPALKVRLMYE